MSFFRVKMECLDTSLISYSYGHLRLLLSFPTRRSSDLLGPQPGSGGGAAGHHRGDLEAGGQARAPGGPGRQGDRKSTRLNSSHVEISYAVFCLKKKRKCLDPRVISFPSVFFLL